MNAQTLDEIPEGRYERVESMEHVKRKPNIKKIFFTTILIVLLVNALIDVSLRIYIRFSIQEQHILEITKLIQETDGEIDEIEVWSEGGKRSFWYTKLNSFRMYDISFTKNGEKKHAIYSYPEGYLLESIEGRPVTGKWYLAPK